MELKPWMKEAEVALASGFLSGEHVYLEWGSGGSTLLFGGLARVAYAIEHDEDWYRRLRDQIVAEGIHYICRPVRPGHRGWEGGQYEGTFLQFQNYVEAVDELGVDSFDRVLIDGRARGSCALKILPYLHDESLVLIHDFWMRPHYWFLFEYYDEIASIYTYQSLVVLKRRTDLTRPYPSPAEVEIPQPAPEWYDGNQPIETSGGFRYRNQRMRYKPRSMQPLAEPRSSSKRFAETSRLSEDIPAWTPWDLAHISRMPRTSVDHKELLKIVTTREKLNIRSLDRVPPDLVTVSDVTTKMQRPRSVGSHVVKGGWYPQLTKSFILHLPSAFIGDNVVFDSDRYYSFNRWWLGPDSDSWKVYANIQEVRHIHAGVSIAAWCGEAFQLFILDALPRLAAVIDLLESPAFAHIKIVTHNEGAPTAQWFWSKLRLTDRIVQKPQNAQSGFVVHADVALFPQCEPNLGGYGLHPRNSLLPIRRRLGVLDPVRQDLVLYLSRRHNRSVANEDHLLARVSRELEGTNYELLIFSSSGDLEKDLQVVKQAKIIFGPHGGAFANIVFAQPGTHVIEFLPIYSLYSQGKHPRPVYWGLAQAAGLVYWTVEPDNFDFYEPGMIVNPDQVAGIIRRVLTESADSS